MKNILFRKGLALILIFLFLGVGVLSSVSGKQATLNLENGALSRTTARIDNPSFSKKMELEPHLLFYIAFGDFYVDGNYVNGTAKILFWLCMKYFIFPEIPHIEFNTDFGAKIISDFYDYYKIMYTNLLEVFGLIAGIITSIGFIPQIIKGYRSKKLEDVSYYMPIVLAIGMTIWFIYGFLKEALAIIIANIIGIFCNIILIIMKKKYS
jgi:MtN3 and saliva related transmembrane protein